MSRTKVVSEAETIALAQRFAERLHPGDVVALYGDLGAGKSLFSRAVMRALAVTDEALPSPTYAVIQEYEGRCAGAVCRVAHMDWYRLGGEEEVEMLGVRDFFQPPWICLVEWPERASSLLPKHHHVVRIEPVAEETMSRWITCSSC